MHKLSRRDTLALTAVGLALVGCMEQLRLLRSLFRRYTNEDHAVLWSAATDWWRLRLREPTFYGQPYGVTFESIPMGLLHKLGLSYGTAFPLTLQLMALCAWFMLAWGAWKRGLWLPALAAASAPVLLNTEHWVVVGVIGTSAGRLLATAAATICLLPRPSQVAVGAAIALGGLGVVADTAAALICLPAFVWVTAAWSQRVRELWLPVCLGLVLPLLWLALNAWFDGRYPDHSLHPGPEFQTSQEALLANYEDLDRLFGVHSAELFRRGALLPSACVALWLIALAARGWSALAAVSCYTGLLVLLASLPKSLDMMTGLWFPAARMTLAAPLGLWFVAATTVEALVARARPGLTPAVRRNATSAAVIVLAGLCMLTSVVRARSWRTRIAAIEQGGLDEQRLPLREVRDIESICSAAQRAAAAAGTRIVIFPFDRAANYACPALYPDMITAYPSYERRYWVLRHLALHTADRMLVWGLPANACARKRFRARLTRCTPLPAEAGLRLDFAVQPPLDVLYALGFAPRPFGAGCQPNDKATCTWWASRYAAP